MSGGLNIAIANAVVRRHRRTVGRGPTEARAFYQRNVIVVMLRDTLTQEERSLVADGEQESVRRLRDALERTMRDDLVREVEGLTGSKVVAFMSATHLDPDMSAQMFVLDRSVTAEPLSAASSGSS
jgi:uncharacterized protein YbcI